MYFLVYGLHSFRTYSPQKTAAILGALEHSEQEEIYRMPPIERRILDRMEERLREALGDATFASAFKEGGQLSIDDTLDLVLKIAEGI